MRALVLREIRSQFERALGERLPMFVSGGKLGGEKFYHWGHEGGMNFYLRLRPEQYFDSFNLNVGWRVEPGFPVGGGKEDPRNGGMLFCLPKLLPAELKTDWSPIPGWSERRLEMKRRNAAIPEKELLPHVAPLMDEVVGLVERFAVPYFESLVHAHARGRLDLGPVDSPRAGPQGPVAPASHDGAGAGTWYFASDVDVGIPTQDLLGLEREWQPLDRICDECGVDRISSFIGGENPERDDEVDDRWFDPTAGLRTVEALMEQGRLNSSGVINPEDISHDLAGLARAFRRCLDCGARWRIGIDI